MVKLKIISCESKNGATGSFVRANTDQGWLSAFEEPAKGLILQSVGKELECEIADRQSGDKVYRNIVSAKLCNGPNAVASVPQETKVISNDGPKSMYVSYVKDLVVAGKTIDEAIEIIKKAKEAF